MLNTMRCELEEGYAYTNGRQLGTIPTVDANHCCQICADTTNCTHYTFITNACWLQTDNNGRQPHQGAFSGSVSGHFSGRDAVHAVALRASRNTNTFKQSMDRPINRSIDQSMDRPLARHAAVVVAGPDMDEPTMPKLIFVHIPKTGGSSIESAIHGAHSVQGGYHDICQGMSHAKCAKAGPATNCVPWHDSNYLHALYSKRNHTKAVTFCVVRNDW